MHLHRSSSFKVLLIFRKETGMIAVFVSAASKAWRRLCRSTAHWSWCELDSFGAHLRSFLITAIAM